jgi:hypothetical protein
MTKKDEAVFAKAFEKMEAEGYFDDLQAKTEAKPTTKCKFKPIEPATPVPKRNVTVHASSSTRKK